MTTKQQNEEEGSYVKEDDNNNNSKVEASWGTWEELLLACAVKRHGFKNWDSVATEVRSRSDVLVSANNCKQKYRDLKRRFLHQSDDVAMEELRNLRVAELRRELERYDVSILSLQLKVKKLEEDREEPDLEDERKSPEEDDRSMNESNSTASREKFDDDKPDRDLKEGSDSDESGTSERKCKRKLNRDGDGGEMRSMVSESEPLISLLDLIRSHPRGSLFERRLRSQETKEYKSLVKQHLDIETIQKKLKKGCYDSSSSSFYRDLQLLFTNAIVFFPSSSSESMAANELRNVVYQEMRKTTGKSSPRLMNRDVLGMKVDAETSESSLSRQKSLGALVVCKRKSLVSAKASPSSSSFSQKEETKEEMLSEDTVAGVRSSRRTSKVAAAKKGKGKNKQKQTESNDDNNTSKQETGKTEKKAGSSDKKKSVADFLKRLKKNSPQKESKDQNKCGKKESKAKPRELRSGKKKAEEENTPVKRTPGRPQKKTAEASGKRGRETGSTGKDNKQPKKRSRR